MSTYLVDFENVGVGGMDGVEKLSDRDRVVIFYGKQAAAVPFERHIEIASSRAEVRYIKVDKTGKNFLDFQLSSYCGYLIGSTSEREFIIVSRDNGFGSMEDFWHGKEMSGKKISMKRRPAIAVSGEEMENVREIIVDKGDRLAAASPEETGREKEKRQPKPAEKAGSGRRRRNGKNQGRPQPESMVKIQTIPVESRKQDPEPARIQEEKAKAVREESDKGERREPSREKEESDKRNCRRRGGQNAEGHRKSRTEKMQEDRPLEESRKQEQEAQTEAAVQRQDLAQKPEEGQEKHSYRKSRRRPRGRYVWRRQQPQKEKQQK